MSKSDYIVIRKQTFYVTQNPESKYIIEKWRPLYAAKQLMGEIELTEKDMVDLKSQLNNNYSNLKEDIAS